MNLTEHDPTIPDDLGAALRRAAAHVPPADLHPSGPVVRLQRRRRRRRTLAAGSAAAAVLVAALAVQQLRDHDDVTTGDPAESGSETGGSGPEGTPGATGFPAPVMAPAVGNELQPDGSFVALPIAQPDDQILDAVRLSDGRLVTLVRRETGTQGAPAAGPEPAASMLAVWDAEGDLVEEQDVGRGNELVMLAGEHEGKVVLQRAPQALNQAIAGPGLTLSAVDPSTLQETDLGEVDAWPGSAQIVGDQMLVAGTDGVTTGVDAQLCPLWVVDLQDLTSRRVPGAPPDCVGINGLALSPDGRRAAIVVAQLNAADSTNSVWLHVVDLASGDIVTSQILHDERGICSTRTESLCLRPDFRAIAWNGPSTALAVVQDPDPADGNSQPLAPTLDPERIRTVSVTVPS
jgi:hypothetical protein